MKEMDLIILDAPPAEMFEDAILAERVDGILYIIRYDMVQKRRILDCIQGLEDAKAPPLVMRLTVSRFTVAATDIMDMEGTATVIMATALQLRRPEKEGAHDFGTLICFPVWTTAQDLGGGV